MENSLVTNYSSPIKQMAIVLMAIFLYLSSKAAQGEIEINNTYIENKQAIKISGNNVAYTEMENLVLDISFLDKQLANMRKISFESKFGSSFVADASDRDTIKYPIERMGIPLSQNTNYQCSESCKMLIRYPYDEIDVERNARKNLELAVSIFDDIGIRLSHLETSNKIPRHDDSIPPIFRWVSFKHKDGSLITKMSEASPVENIKFDVIYEAASGRYSKKGELSRGHYTITEVPDNIQKLMVKLKYQSSPEYQYLSNVILHNAQDPFFVDNDRRWGFILTKGLLHNDMGASSL